MLITNTMKKTLYYKRRILQSEINITGLICNGLIHHTPKQTVLRQIKKELIFLQKAVGLENSEAHMLWYEAVKQYNWVSKRTFSALLKLDLKFGKEKDYDESLHQRTQVVYNTVRESYIRNNQLVKIRNRVAYTVEKREKHDYLWEKFHENQENDHYSPFFLASAHQNPAKDHADWEGKMYFDEDWEKFVQNDADQARIRAYIRNHDLKSVQWVVGEPVYLVTRPNCKHYLMNIPIDDVLSSSVKSLLKRKKMYMPDEQPASKERLAYRGYYERLKTEVALNELVPNEQLSKDIAKDRKLVDKYARYDH